MRTWAMSTDSNHERLNNRNLTESHGFSGQPGGRRPWSMVAQTQIHVETFASTGYQKRMNYTWACEIKPNRATCSVLTSSSSRSDSCVQSRSHSSSVRVQVHSGLRPKRCSCARHGAPVRSAVRHDGDVVVDDACAPSTLVPRASAMVSPLGVRQCPRHSN